MTATARSARVSRMQGALILDHEFTGKRIDHQPGHRSSPPADQIALLAGCLVSVIGIYFLVRDVGSMRSRPFFSPGSAYQWLGAAVVCFLLLGPILANPLKDWDARSIWFFHAKRIYTAGTIGQSAGWRDPSIEFSHPDYPILGPVLASQIVTITGFWNEFIPKVTLFFLLLPPVLWLFSFARKSIAFAVLILLIPFTLNRWMWNGYMDAYLVLYFAAALLLFGRYIRAPEIIDLISGLCCLVMLLYLKNEVVLAALGLVCSLVWIYLLMRKTGPLNFLKIDWRYYLAGFLAILPFLLWSGYKWHWNISNDLEIGTVQSISRIGSRVVDGSSHLVFESIFQQMEAGLLVLTLLWLAARGNSVAAPIGGLMPSESKRQRRMMGADLRRAREGKRTSTGMSEEQLEDFAETSEEHLPARAPQGRSHKGRYGPSRTTRTSDHRERRG